MSDTPTPLSDAKTARLIRDLGPANNQRFAAMADFARQLERELADSEKLTERLAKFKGALIADKLKIERELSELYRDCMKIVAAIKKRDGKDMVDISTMDRIAELHKAESELEQARQDREQADLDAIRALGERNDARKELEEIKAILANPLAVHLNMMRGTIQWTPANLYHLLGQEPPTK